MALLGGFFWVFFFFSLSHFQGNKTRCHLLVAMAISPDSASAAEEEKSWESAVLPQSPELLRAVGRAWINGALSDPGNGPIHGIQGRSCGFLRAQVGPSLNCFGVRQMCRTSGDVAMVCLEGGFGCWGSGAHLWLHPEDRAGLRIAPHPTSQHRQHRGPHSTRRNGGEAFSQQARSRTPQCSPNAAPQPTCPALCPPHTPCRGHNVLHHCQRAQLSSHRFGLELPTATERRVPSALTLPQWPHCCSTQTAQIYPRAEGSSSPTLATGLWAPGPAQHHHPCTPIPFLLGTNTRRSATRTRAPPQTHPPTLPVCALHPGLPQMGSLPRTVPSSSHVPLAGVEGKASGSHWLPFAVSRAPNEHTVISGASRPAPSQNTATLGEALYSQRQTTHICFLTVGIAPSGTGGTGNPLSPSPCD